MPCETDQSLGGLCVWVECAVTEQNTMKAVDTELPPEAKYREQARVCPEGLMCDLGEVLDVSTGGAKIETRRALKGTIDVRFWSEHDGLEVTANVIWCKRKGFRRYRVGMQFISLTKEETETLINLALKPNPNWNAGATGDLFDQLGR